MIIDDFKELKVCGANFKGWRGHQDKGYLLELSAFAHSILKGSAMPIPRKDIIKVTKISFTVDQMVTSWT